jgi:hypothetical protein
MSHTLFMLHQVRTTIVVAPLMLAEAITAAALLWLRPEGVSPTLCLLGMTLIVLLWASTFYWQVPAHGKLQHAFHAASHDFLVRSNWVRTVGWSARGALVCVMMHQAL